jgi:hypothetical protein
MLNDKSEILNRWGPTILDTKSISGNNEKFGVLTNMQTVKTVRHHPDIRTAPMANTQSEYDSMTTW